MNDAKQTKTEALLRRARAGEHEALAELYEATYPELWRTVRTLVKNEADALDIVQDSYLKAFTHLDRLTNDASLLPWLRTIAANTARDHLRRKKPALFSELSDEESDQLTDIPDDRLSDLPENRLEQDESRRYLAEILDTLSDAQRLVVGLYYDQALPIKTIAARLDLPQNTVKSQLRYSRQKIERQVRALERQGVRLYGLSPILFFRMLLQDGSAVQPAPRALRTLEGELSRRGLQALAGEGSRRVLTAARHSSILRSLGLGLACLAGAAGIIAGAGLLRQTHGGDVRPSEPTDAIPHLEQQILSEDNAPKLPIDLPAESTAPPETAAERPEEVDIPAAYAEQTPAAYQEILRQYRAAALDAAFDPADYPLVNADAIRRLQSRWAAYADGSCSLGVRFADLDGDGLEEMELRLMQYAGYEEYDCSPFVGLYTQQDGQSAALLGPDETGNNAAVEYFEGGYILTWENGRYTSPCALNVYQLLQGGTALTVLGRWSCTLDELGFSHYERAGDAKTWTLAYLDADGNRFTGGLPTPSGWHAVFLDEAGGQSTLATPYVPALSQENGEIAGEIRWRFVSYETPYGYQDQLPLASNPGTDAPQAVVPLAEVLPEYAMANTGAQILAEEPDAVFPYITLSGAAFEEFNRAVQAEATEVLAMDALSVADYFVDHGAFDWAVNGDILSIVTYDYAGGGYTHPTIWNFSISEGRRLSDAELLEQLGIDPARFRTAARDALHGRYLRSWERHPLATAGMLCAAAHSVVLAQLGDMQLTLDRDGTPVVYSYVGSCAGGSAYIRCVPVYLP